MSKSVLGVVCLITFGLLCAAGGCRRDPAPGPAPALVRGYVNASGIGKTGSCHLFRHTMATLMLENGADIRFIQAMLGHVSLTTTEIYSHVAIRKLKEIHTATHPGARLERAAAATNGGTVEEPAAAEDEATELLASLAAEAAEEEGDGVSV